jgi:hypothetical protein
MAQNTNRPLKAYVRFDGTGRIVPSSLILRRKKPKVGKWVEILQQLLQTVVQALAQLLVHLLAQVQVQQQLLRLLLQQQQQQQLLHLKIK